MLGMYTAIKLATYELHLHLHNLYRAKPNHDTPSCKPRMELLEHGQTDYSNHLQNI